MLNMGPPEQKASILINIKSKNKSVGIMTTKSPENMTGASSKTCIPSIPRQAMEVCSIMLV